MSEAFNEHVEKKLLGAVRSRGRTGKMGRGQADRERERERENHFKKRCWVLK